ncbi:MAG: glycosyl hydrolase 53 family protein [Treponema sp.]|nr:glycosyl hydrolase 53 family protein [Candidatus Treponema equi]
MTSTRTKKSLAAAIAVCLFTTAFAAKKAAPVLIPGTFIRGADVTCLYDLEKSGAKFFDTDGTEKEMLAILKDHGANWIRLRVWVAPESDYGMSAIEKAAETGKKAKALGFRILLDLQYSDAWTNVDSQKKPASWDPYIMERLTTEIGKYSRNCMETMKKADALPDMVQLGSEINKGILLTTSKDEHATINGKLGTDACVQLLNTAASSIRDFDSMIQIMLHFGKGGDKTEIAECLDKIDNVNYDWIGLSYYPFYTDNGTAENLGNTIKYISSKGKKVMIAETSFPWTCEIPEEQADAVKNSVWYNGDDGSMMQVYDNLMNVPNLAFGSYSGKKIIKPSKYNQKNYLEELKKIIYINGGKGFFYFGGDWMTLDRKDPAKGSPWENQALFDLDHKALSAVEAFSN